MKLLIASLIISLTGLLSPAIAQAQHSVALSWTAPTVDSTHGAATGYNVYRTQTSGGCATVPAAGCSKLSSPTAVTYTDSTVLGGQTYFYVTTGTNASGESVPSNQATASIPADSPNAPTNLTVTSVH